MKYTTAILALAAAAAKAQDLSLFPECSRPCIIDAVGTSTNCAIDDYPCICNNMDAVKQAATPCVVNACGIDVALNEVLPATEEFCAQVLNPGSSSASPASSVPSASPSPSPSTTPPATSAIDTPPAATADPTSPSSSAAGSSFATTMPVLTTSTSGSGSGNSTSPTSSAVTAGAAATAAPGLVMGSGLGMLILGLAAAAL